MFIYFRMLLDLMTFFMLLKQVNYWVVLENPISTMYFFLNCYSFLPVLVRNEGVRIIISQCLKDYISKL